MVPISLPDGEGKHPCLSLGAYAFRCTRASAISAPATNAIRQKQHMIQALSTERANEPFDICVLPRRSRCCRAVPNSHWSQPVQESATIGAVIVANQVDWAGVPGERLHDLLSQPFG